jgi:hypothetical protein
MLNVVFPTPPFWLSTAITGMGPPANEKLSISSNTHLLNPIYEVPLNRPLETPICDSTRRADGDGPGKLPRLKSVTSSAKFFILKKI